MVLFKDLKIGTKIAYIGSYGKMNGEIICYYKVLEIQDGKCRLGTLGGKVLPNFIKQGFDGKILDNSFSIVIEEEKTPRKIKISELV